MNEIVAADVKAAIEHYRIWVLLVFKREQLRLEVGKSLEKLGN